MSEKEAKIPIRRFKEFEHADAWEQRKVLDLLIQPVTDGPHETPKLVERGIPFISVDAIVDNKIDFSRKRGDISEEYDIECCKKYKPQYHDVYVVKSGSTVGKVAIVETTDRFNIWSPLAALRCGDITYPYYLYYLLQTDKMQAQISDKASNGTQPNLSMRELEKFDVKVAVDIEEQKQIGDYFKSLDNLITLHQRKLEKIKSLKKAYLSEMFPAKGECKPKRRFAGYTDAWEQRKLGEVTDSYSGGTPTVSKSEYYGGNIPFIRSAEINSDSTELFLTEEGLKNSSAKMVEIGDILYALYGATSGDVGISQIHGAINQAILDIKPRDGYNSQFIMQWLRLQKQKIIDKYLQGGQGNLSGSIVKDLEILFPSCDEQTKIGEYLKNLDHLITLHRRKLEKLKSLKQAYLNEMFV